MGLLEEMVAQDVANSCHFTRKVAAFRAQREKEKNDDRQFYGSIGVGNITSLTDCPSKIIESKKNQNWYAKKQLATMFAEGTEIHEAYQKDGRLVPGLLAPEPTNIRPELLEKYRERGELPVRFYSKDGTKLISGYIDFVQLVKGKISIVEMKSTNCTPEDFKSRFEKVVLAPNKKHQIQLKTYMYMVKDYWPGYEMAPGELVYVCARIMSGEEGREKSVWVHLTEDDIDHYDKMFAEIERQLTNCPESPLLPCEYKYCREHGTKKDASET